MCVGAELDEYCETIGIAPGYDDACLGSHFMIYTEPGTALQITKAAIENALGICEATPNLETL
jgi:hypothetical protein